jgi:ATP-dependent Clp protease ATP-binding subunit ClpA
MSDDVAVGRLFLRDFSFTARSAVGTASAVANADGVQRIDSQHLLVALVHSCVGQDSEARQIVSKLNVSTREILMKCDLTWPEDISPVLMPTTYRLAGIIDEAQEISHLLTSRLVTTGSLLYALAADVDSRGARLLKELSIQPNEILDLLTLGREDILPRTLAQLLRKLPAERLKELSDGIGMRYNEAPADVQEQIEHTVDAHVQIDPDGWLYLRSQELSGTLKRTSLIVPTKQTVIPVGIINGQPLDPEK